MARIDRPATRWAILGLAIAASFVLIGLWGAGETFRGDEWGYAQRLAAQSLGHTVIHPPPGKYLIALPLAYYDLMLHAFGLSDYTPNRVVGIALLGAAGVLMFLYARRRVGGWIALVPAILILFLGAGWEVTAAPLRIPVQFAVVAGLGALLALDRPRFSGDVAACLLLTVAVTSHPVGLAFVAAGFILVLARPGAARWRGIWVALVPLAIYGLWYLTAYSAPPGQTRPTAGDVLSFAVNSFVAFCGAATGFFRSPWASKIDFINPFSVAVALLAAAATLWVVRSPRRVPASTWAVLALLAILAIAPAFAPGVTRDPSAPRYLYPGAVAMLLLAVELARGWTLRREGLTAAVAAVALIAAVSLVSNVRTLHEKADGYAASSADLRLELAALDAVRGKVKQVSPPLPVGALTQPNLIAPRVPTSAGSLPTLLARAAPLYYVVSDQFGTPAPTPEELSHRDQRKVDRLVTALTRPG